MNTLAGLSLSMALLLAAFPMISMGTTQGPPFLWWAGLFALVVGGLIPPASRFLAAVQPKPQTTTLAGDGDERP